MLWIEVLLDHLVRVSLEVRDFSLFVYQFYCLSSPQVYQYFLLKLLYFSDF